MPQHTKSKPFDLISSLSGVRISSSSPCSDGYEARNLLALERGGGDGNTFSRTNSNNRGFMAERFVKPPVLLQLMFPCTFRLKAVVIENTIGSFTSSGLQVMSYSCHQGREADPLPVYKVIGKAFNTTPGVVYFINHMYNTDPSHFAIPDSSQVFPLSSHDSTLLNHCRYLTIKISQTLGAGIPAIRLIKVIAYPHSFSYLKPPLRNDESHMDAVPEGSKQDVTREDNLESDIQRNDNEVINSDDNIPKEFVDPLTCEFMSLPVILPSGYTVDQRTLDRHVEMEVSWGRNPTDPYTGVVLTTSNQPIINHKLKERIDRYALLNNISVGRISGRKRKLEEGSDPDNTTKRLSTITSTCDDISQTSTLASSDRNLTTQSPVSGKSTAHIIDLTGDETNVASNALSSRLSKVLAKTSNLRTVTVPDASLSQCVQCGCKIKTHVQMFYSLTCAHLICKTCLTSVIEKTVKCITCSRESLKADVSRYHSV